MCMVLESVRGSRQRVVTWALRPRRLEVNFFWAPNAGEAMSSDTRDGILYEYSKPGFVTERGPVIRNADCEDIESHTKVGRILVLLCVPSSQTMNDSSSGFSGKVGEITGTE